MSKVSAYLRDCDEMFSHWCPGCEEMHMIPVAADDSPKWSFDGNVECPTFNPSVNIRIGPRPTVPAGRSDAGQIDVCHYFLHGGVLKFCADSTHALAGQDVPLPPIPDFVDD